MDDKLLILSKCAKNLHGVTVNLILEVLIIKKKMAFGSIYKVTIKDKSFRQEDRGKTYCQKD